MKSETVFIYIFQSKIDHIGYYPWTILSFSQRSGLTLTVVLSPPPRDSLEKVICHATFSYGSKDLFHSVIYGHLLHLISDFLPLMCFNCWIIIMQAIFTISFITTTEAFSQVLKYNSINKCSFKSEIVLNYFLQIVHLNLVSTL